MTNEGPFLSLPAKRSNLNDSQALRMVADENPLTIAGILLTAANSRYILS